MHLYNILFNRKQIVKAKIIRYWINLHWNSISVDPFRLHEQLLISILLSCTMIVMEMELYSRNRIIVNTHAVYPVTVSF